MRIFKSQYKISHMNNEIYKWVDYRSSYMCLYLVISTITTLIHDFTVSFLTHCSCPQVVSLPSLLCNTMVYYLHSNLFSFLNHGSSYIFLLLKTLQWLLLQHTSNSLKFMINSFSVWPGFILSFHATCSL